jgi:hypothetical protein
LIVEIMGRIRPGIAVPKSTNDRGSGFQPQRWPFHHYPETWQHQACGLSSKPRISH